MTTVNGLPSHVQLGYVALIAMCPAAAGVVRPSAANRNRLV
jgi:hypothetical protein